MACNRTRVRNLGNKKYPTVRTLPRHEFISNKNLELENVIVELLETDTKTVIFDKPFSGAPSVIANFVSNLPLPNANVFVESISTSQVIIRTSAPVTGQVHVQAMYIES
jgi:hypothetical protein